MKKTVKQLGVELKLAKKKREKGWNAWVKECDKVRKLNVEIWKREHKAKGGG